jgi:hypothetical protein
VKRKWHSKEVKKMTSFILKIKMGNAAMRTHSDVVDALKKVVKKMQDGDGSGVVMDINGNKVGHFGLVK